MSGCAVGDLALYSRALPSVGGGRGTPRHAMFGSILFAIPVLALAILDRDATDLAQDEPASLGGVLVRAIVFAAIAIAGVAIVLWPYWVALLKNPINQMPIPHGSRDNYILASDERN